MRNNKVGCCGNIYRSYELLIEIIKGSLVSKLDIYTLSPVFKKLYHLQIQESCEL